MKNLGNIEFTIEYLEWIAQTMLVGIGHVSAFFIN
jgi:hypothetical protein